MTDPVTRRPVQDSDEAFLRVLFEETRERQFRDFPLVGDARTGFLDMQFRAMRMGYRASFPNAEHWVLVVKEQPVGVLILDRSATEIRVVDIGLLSSHRGQGLGQSVLAKIQSEADMSVALSVDHDNPARRLYDRLGFVAVSSSELATEMIWTHPTVSDVGIL